ncbi:rRNA pseudouridine synthase [Virgibacillus sp. MSJ-26]|uniref:pseudouridine synthase n=1 Tax=Virgibacillus sp. MSJ-26 TaxID=2841522 RepID=UPI001C0F43B2|nr:pseudouridine synthase [Virgibacillus sp. MSJ-26]MBU5466299.1 rRNA pseudouridine synthase [Virgibacillus sp. MSJ-26]
MSNSLERLQKVISQSGITSRRKAEQLIVDGKVKVNNKVVTELGTKVSKTDKVEVNGVEIEKEQLRYYLLYKPRGVISSVKDDKHRKVVTDILADIPERIFPIGRLDYNTSGVLLLTNDGEFANLLMHPRHEVEKVYLARIKGIPTKRELGKLLAGVKDNNEILKAKHYQIITTDSKRGVMELELTLNEGKNRHIRRMMNQIGYPVTKLKRIKYGLLTLKDLSIGQYRPLNPKEVKQMRNLALKNVED